MSDLQEAVIKHAQRDMAADRTMAQPQGITPPQQAPSLMDAIKESKLLGEIAAIGREGAKDLWNNIVPAFPDSARAVDEPGTALNPTQYMVNEDLRAYEADLERAASYGNGRERERGLER